MTAPVLDDFHLDIRIGDTMGTTLKQHFTTEIDLPITTAEPIPTTGIGTGTLFA